MLPFGTGSHIAEMLLSIAGLIWLRSVVEKLSVKHGVSQEEVEQVFDNAPRLRRIARGNVVDEDLYAATGRSDAGRYLIVFFIQKLSGEALVISARDMSQRERRQYAEK